MKDETTDLPSKVRDYLKQVYPGYSLCVRYVSWELGSHTEDKYDVTIFPVAGNNQICVNIEEEKLSLTLDKVHKTMALAGVKAVDLGFVRYSTVRPYHWHYLLVRATPRAEWPVESHTLYDFLHPNTTQQ